VNELIFFIHILLVISFALGAVKLGKEALTVWVVCQALLANLFVIKQMDFFGWNVTCSDVFIIGSVIGLNLLQEFFGQKSAKKATWICFFFMLFFTLMSQIHLAYLPSNFDTTHDAFLIILSPAPRLLIASLLVFFLVQRLDVALFAKLKARWKAPLFVRNLISTAATQALDTALFTLLGLFGLVSNLLDIMLLSFTVKLIIILCITPFLHLCKRLIRVEAP
jgi:queuosine precursor transporter